MNELDDAMDAIPNITEEQLQMLIDYQIKELALYDGRKSRGAKKDQPEEDVMLALEKIVREQSSVPAKPQGKFLRRF